jgi:hypothetical protein
MSFIVLLKEDEKQLLMIDLEFHENQSAPSKWERDSLSTGGGGCWGSIHLTRSSGDG